MSDLLRATYNPLKQPGAAEILTATAAEQEPMQGFIDAMKEGFAPYKPTDVTIEMEYNVDYNQYRFIVQVYKSRLFVYEMIMRRDDVLDLHDNLRTLGVAVGRGISQQFRSHRLIEPEDHIILGES